MSINISYYEQHRRDMANVIPIVNTFNEKFRKDIAFLDKSIDQVATSGIKNKTAFENNVDILEILYNEYKKMALSIIDNLQETVSLTDECLQKVNEMKQQYDIKNHGIPSLQTLSKKSVSKYGLNPETSEQEMALHPEKIYPSAVEKGGKKKRTRRKTSKNRKLRGS
jgi:hypothetical protein